MAAYADLILTASREHRDVVMTELPSVYKQTFTMKEFARLLSHVPPGEPHAVVAAAAARRGHVKPVELEDDDVRDPYRGAIKHAKTIAEEITETVYATLDAPGFPPSGGATRRRPGRTARPGRRRTSRCLPMHAAV